MLIVLTVKLLIEPLVAARKLVVRLLKFASEPITPVIENELTTKLLMDPVRDVIELVVSVLKVANGAITLFVVSELTFRLLTDPVTDVMELVVSVLKVAKGPVILLTVSVLALKVLTDPSLVTTLSETKEEISAVLINPFTKLILAACKELTSKLLKVILSNERRFACRLLTFRVLIDANLVSM